MSDETTPLLPSADETQPRHDPFPGEFHVERLLGSGAFGEVWLAHDLSPLARRVALKFLRLSPSRARNDQALAALRHEARLLASLRHPNIVQVHAWKHAPGAASPCLVLHYVNGGSLDKIVSRAGALPWHVAARYVADVADGLLLVHAKGIIHRDLKPANMLLDIESDEALLTDFGIAARLAEPGVPAGSPAFMAPEAFGGELSPAVDVYGLAASLFWLVTRDHPYPGDDTTQILASMRIGLPSSDSRFAGVPAPLERLLRAALDASPERRPSLPDFVRQLRGDLNRLLADTLPASDQPVDLRLTVSRQGVVVAPTAASSAVLRDMKRVPAEPASLALRSGERVRVAVSADRDGYVTVFNVGPTGNLNLLYPTTLGMVPLLPAGQPLDLGDIELTPPAGRERLVALWTRRPLPVRLEELRSLIECGDRVASGAYRATRDMVRVQKSLIALPEDERRTVVVELDHQ